MKLIFFCSLFAVSSVSYAQDSSSWKDRLGAEVGGIYLTQSDSSGETYSALPMISYKILSKEKFHLNAQAGVTALKDSASDETFAVGVFRANPIYHLGESKFSVEGLLGLQFWGKGEALNFDLGARLNYNIHELSRNYLDEVFVGGGLITNEETYQYLTAGVKKWF